VGALVGCAKTLDKEVLPNREVGGPRISIEVEVPIAVGEGPFRVDKALVVLQQRCYVEWSMR